MTELKRKITSRKLWLAIVGIVTGIALALGVPSSEISSIVGSVISVISAATYIVVEGKIDAARVSGGKE